METLLLFVVLIVLFIRWRIVSSRIKRLDGRIREAERSANQAAQIGQLTDRIQRIFPFFRAQVLLRIGFDFLGGGDDLEDGFESTDTP